MDRQIIVWCSKCKCRIDDTDNAYCERCLDAKDGELQQLDERIKELENEILKLKGGE